MTVIPAEAGIQKSPAARISLLRYANNVGPQEKECHPTGRRPLHIPPEG